MAGVGAPRGDEYLTTCEAAERAGLGAHILRSAINRRLLPVRREGSGGSRNRVLIATRDLEAWLRVRQQKQDCARRVRGRHSPEWGALLTSTRQSRGLPKVELAQRAGVSPSYITLMEQGAVPKREHVVRLAQALGLDVNHCLLVGGYAPHSVAVELMQVLSLLTMEEQLVLARSLTKVRASTSCS